MSFLHLIHAKIAYEVVQEHQAPQHLFGCIFRNNQAGYSQTSNDKNKWHIRFYLPNIDEFNRFHLILHKPEIPPFLHRILSNKKVLHSNHVPMPFCEIKITKSENRTELKPNTCEWEKQYATSHPRPCRNKIQNKISKEVKGKTNSRVGLGFQFVRAGQVYVGSFVV